MAASRAIEQIVLRHGEAVVPTLVFRPAGAGPWPAVVLSAEAYGINDFTRDVGGRLADAGYVVVVPDYYRGHGLERPDDYSDFTEVMRFIDELDFVGGTRDILAGVDYARALPEVDPSRVGVWGYCTGGTLAMLAAALGRDLAAAVLFFPSQPTFPELTPLRPVHPVDLLWAIECPVLLIYGGEDAIAAKVLDDVRARFTRWQVDHQINIYPGAGHAFSAPVPPLRHEAADRASWIDAIDFAHQHLSR